MPRTTMTTRALIAVAVLAVPATRSASAQDIAATAQPACPWVHSTAPIPQRVAQVVSRMTLAEKIRMVHGSAGSGYTGYMSAIPRLCIPALKLEDGPAGVADGVKGVTQFPAPVAVAASWDTALARAYGAVIGNEEKRKGVNVNLGPTVNIVRDPRWGRAFEAYSEDPFLTGEMAVAYIQGVQSQGVMAQVKHLAVYNQETFRNTRADTVIVDARALHEIYLPAFQAAVTRGGASSVMCSYNMLGADFACEHAAVLDTILKQRWGFSGFVTSDWAATHSTVASANHGLDMEMPDSSHFGAALAAAIDSGKVATSRLDDMVSRMLRQYFRFHLFERTPTGNISANVTSAAHAAAARHIAEQGMVLLRNQNQVLPLDMTRVHSIAVIGPSAGQYARTAGGGSAAVLAQHIVTPLQGIQHRAGKNISVRFAQGTTPPDGDLPAIPAKYFNGLSVAFYNDMTLSGPVVATRADSMIDVDFRDQAPAPGVNANEWSARWTGTLTPPLSGEYTFALTSDDGSRLFINGKQIIDNWRDQAPTTSKTNITLTAGQPVRIEVQFYQKRGGDMVSLGWQPPVARSQLDEAVDLAKTSDVAVVFVSAFQTEGADLANIDLPGGQNDLIRAVAAANPRTVVVLNTGSAVTMPWLDSVSGVMEAWYSGQEDGDAIAAVLFGDVNPGAKLPVTFPKQLADVPASTAVQFPGVNGVVRYSEGLRVGYRWYQSRDVAPLFPFGFGLSYTTFRFSNLSITRQARAAIVQATITNTGTRAGSDVVQIYVGFPITTGEPPWQLKAFRKVHLAPGERRRVTFRLDASAFAHWDAAAADWAVDAGNYRIGIGDSSADLPLQGRVAQH